MSIELRLGAHRDCWKEEEGLKWLVELSDGTHLGKAVLKVEARFNQLI